MSDNDRSREGVSDKNCGTCRWRAIDGYCDYEIPPELPEWLDQLWNSESKRVCADDYPYCQTWQAKEKADG